MWPQLASSLPVFDGLIFRLTKEVEPQVYLFSGFNFRVLQVRTTLNLGPAVAGPLSQTFRFFARAYFSAIIPFENVLFAISENPAAETHSETAESLPQARRELSLDKFHRSRPPSKTREPIPRHPSSKCFSPASFATRSQGFSATHSRKLLRRVLQPGTNAKTRMLPSIRRKTRLSPHPMSSAPSARYQSWRRTAPSINPWA